jgi:AraC-like DNA-binding protein
MYDIPTMISYKLKSFNHRESRQDLQDIQWLAEKHEQVVNAIRHKLNYEHKEFFFEAFINEHGQGPKTERMRQIFGVTWPPEE